MTEHVDKVEQRFDANLAEVLEKVKKVNETTEIEYVAGFENRVGCFSTLESLDGRPVLARFSYGKNAPNMSSVFFDSRIGESETTGDNNVRDFLNEQGFSGYPNVFHVLGKFEGTEAQIEEVDRDTEKKKIVGNLVFTRDPEVTLMIKPADCPTAIIYCHDKYGNPLVAIDHSGADATNAGMTRQGLWYLQDELGVDLSKAIITVFPGVSQDNFYITNEPERRGNGIIERNWGPFIAPKATDDPSEKRYVDILSAFEMQAIQAGILPENIHAIRRDTYLDAANGIAYSRRYSNEHNNQHPGGNLLVVQLRDVAQY